MSDKDPIEEMLKKMQPAELPSHVMARLTATRPQSREVAGRSSWRGVLFRWALPLVAGVCVAVGTFFWLEREHRSPGPGTVAATVAPEQRPLPVASENYLVGARPVGILVAPDRRPYRVVEVEWIEHQTVRTGAGRPDLHTATTRRDVVPVALELY